MKGFLQTRRESAETAGNKAGPSEAGSGWGFWLAAGLGIAWGILFLIQPIWPTDVAAVESELNGPRWLLWLVPDQTIGSWFAGRVTLAGVGERTIVLFAAAVGWIVAWGSGRWLVDAWPPLPTALSRLERVAVATLAGLTVQAWTTLGAGLLGLIGSRLSAPLILAVSAGVAWLVAFAVRRGRAGERLVSPPAEESAADEPVPDATGPGAAAADDSVPGWARQLPRFLWGGMAALLIARAMMPPAEYDVREYHLQAPKEWSQGGEITFLPHNIYANMPMAAEMHVVWAIDAWRLVPGAWDAWWWGALSGKLLMAGYLILASGLLGEAVRRLGDPLAGRWTRVLVVGMPALFQGASLGLVEAAVACFFAAGLWASVAIWQAVGRELPLVTAGWLGLWSGGAIACKYPAVLFVAFPLAVVGGWLTGPQSWNKRCRAAALFAAVALLVGGPWYLKNAILAGNPVYPLAASWWGGETMTAAKIAQWNAAHQHDGYSVAQVGAALKRLSWQWQLQSLLVVPLALLGAVAGWRLRATRGIIAGLLASLLLWWLFTHRIERFVLPAFTLLFLLAGVGWAVLRRSTGWRLATFVALLGVGMDGLMVAGPLVGDSRLAVDLSVLRRDEPVGEAVSRLPEHVRYVNAQLQPTDSLLLVGDAAAFDYHIPVAYSTTFDESPLTRITREHPPAGWGAALRGAGFSHVLVHWGEIERLRSTYGFESSITPALFETLQQVGALQRVPVELGGGVVELYRVVPAES